MKTYALRSTWPIWTKSQMILILCLSFLVNKWVITQQMNMDTHKYLNFQSTVNQISNQTIFFLPYLNLTKYIKALCFYWDRVSCGPDWPLTHNIAKDELWLLVLQLTPPVPNAMIRGFHHHVRFYVALETKLIVSWLLVKHC